LPALRRGALRPVAVSPQDILPSTVDDHELMEAAAEGDSRAFAFLVARYLGGMVALALRITGNVSNAEEIAQEGFLRLWKQAPRWDPLGAGSVRTWLSRVIVNLCLDRRRRRPFVALEEAGDLVDSSKGAFETARDNDRQKIIREMLQEIPARQRTAVVLSYYEQLSGEEMAEVMGLSVGAVESLLVRARRALRQKAVKKGLTRSEDI